MVVNSLILQVAIFFHIIPSLADLDCGIVDILACGREQVAGRRADPVFVVVPVGRIEIEGGMSAVLLHLHRPFRLLDRVVDRTGEWAGIDISVIDNLPQRDVGIAKLLKTQSVWPKHRDIKGEIEFGRQVVIAALGGAAANFVLHLPESLASPLGRLCGIVVMIGIRAGVRRYY